MTTTPKTPNQTWFRSYLADSLVQAKAYTIDTPDVEVKLDQNESPWDWSAALKKKVLNRVEGLAWNRYPSAYSPELCDLVAKYVGVKSENILLAPGSNLLCTLLLTTLTKSIKGKLIIASPSFPLYEGHCHYEDLPYERWPLNDDLEYDLSLLPEVTSGSVVIFASPNNPVGNVLPIAIFREMLQQYPDTLFLADEAYFEYSNEPFTELLSEFSNLILIRTFSKTLGSAGLRLGYLVAAKEYIDELKKPRLPFLLNHFTIAAAETMLTDEDCQQELNDTIAKLVNQRERVYQELLELSEAGLFTVKPSAANFVMIRFADHEKCQRVYQGLIDHQILVRNISKGPKLAGCLRVTIGNEDENSRFLNAFRVIQNAQ